MLSWPLEMTAKNMVNILIKDIPAALLPLMVPMAVFAQTYLVLETLLTNRRPRLRKNIGGYFVGLSKAVKQIPRMLEKRRHVQRNRKLSASEFWSMMRFAEKQKRSSKSRVTPGKRGSVW